MFITLDMQHDLLLMTSLHLRVQIDDSQHMFVTHDMQHMLIHLNIVQHLFVYIYIYTWSGWQLTAPVCYSRHHATHVYSP